MHFLIYFLFKNRCNVRKIRVRKTFVLLSTVMPAGALLLMTTSGCNIYASLAMAITTQFFFAFNIAGAKCNPNDIGPQVIKTIKNQLNSLILVCLHHHVRCQHGWQYSRFPVPPNCRRSSRPLWPHVAMGLGDYIRSWWRVCHYWRDVVPHLGIG